MKLFIAVITCCFFSGPAFSQNTRFCKAVEKGNFKKAERIFKRQVKKRKGGTAYYNGPGSGYQITHFYNLDTLTMWLKNMPCVEDAVWDKCQQKEMIYPGSSSVGVKFNTKKGIVEKCFWIQEGTTGNVNIFGWKPHIFKSRDILRYKKMYDCKGFTELQRKNCGDTIQSKPTVKQGTSRICILVVIGINLELLIRNTVAEICLPATGQS